MGAMKELYLIMIDKLTEAGRADATTDKPVPTDKQLCDIAADAITMEQFEALLGAEVDPLTTAEMREAYNRGRYLALVQYFEAIAERLRPRGIATVLDEGDNGPTLHAGERSQWPDSNGTRHRAVLLGIGAHYTDQDLASYEPDREPPRRLGFASQDDERDGEFVPDDATAEQVASRIARLVQRVEAQRHRLDMAVEHATEGMWDGVVKAYPEVSTGDFGPGETFELERIVRASIKLWLIYNRPAEGIAATAEAAAEIVAARRKTAIERATPMVKLIQEEQPDNLAALLHETLQDDARRRGEGYDTKWHPDWLVWTAVYERASILHEATYTADAADVATLLVDQLGAYHAVKALIEAAEGELCDGRLPDGDLCGASLDDGEGYDGKCGNCADRIENNRQEG